MIIRTEEQVTANEIKSIDGITKKTVIGPFVKSNELVLRIMVLEVGASTPYHSHPFPHIWKIQRGKGKFINLNKEEIVVDSNDYLFIEANELHSLQNISNENLEYLCFGSIESEQFNPYLKEKLL